RVSADRRTAGRLDRRTPYAVSRADISDAGVGQPDWAVAVRRTDGEPVARIPRSRLHRGAGRVREAARTDGRAVARRPVVLSTRDGPVRAEGHRRRSVARARRSVATLAGDPA